MQDAPQNDPIRAGEEALAELVLASRDMQNERYAYATAPNDAAYHQHVRACLAAESRWQAAYNKFLALPLRWHYDLINDRFIIDAVVDYS